MSSSAPIPPIAALCVAAHLGMLPAGTKISALDGKASTSPGGFTGSLWRFRNGDRKMDLANLSPAIEEISTLFSNNREKPYQDALKPLVPLAIKGFENLRATYQNPSTISQWAQYLNIISKDGTQLACDQITTWISQLQQHANHSPSSRKRQGASPALIYLCDELYRASIANETHPIDDPWNTRIDNVIALYEKARTSTSPSQQKQLDPIITAVMLARLSFAPKGAKLSVSHTKGIAILSLSPSVDSDDLITIKERIEQIKEGQNQLSEEKVKKLLLVTLNSIPHLKESYPNNGLADKAVGRLEALLKEKTASFNAPTEKTIPPALAFICSEFMRTATECASLTSSPKTPPTEWSSLIESFLSIEEELSLPQPDTVSEESEETKKEN